jgi:amino-acid N-acetyltransferase
MSIQGETAHSRLTPNTSTGVAIRVPHIHEIDMILRIFESEVRAGKMLPRSPEAIRQRIDDWLVVTVNGHIAGCVSLVFFNEELCEVRSLAVDTAYRGQGLGGLLIKMAIRLAEERGMRRVLTLTRATPVFERLGFKLDLVRNFPEKVWKDCVPCPLRERCDEVALVYLIEPSSTGRHSNNDAP